MKHVRCQDCGTKVTDTEARPRPCPFAEEIHGIITLIVVCNACYQERVWDI